MGTNDLGEKALIAAAQEVGKESVNKISEAFGAIFPFFDTKRQAVATYISEIQNSNLSPEAKMMTIAGAKDTYRHLKNQMSIGKIAQDVAEEGTDFSSSSGVNDEWLERFMDSAKFVSDEKVQILWGNILAKEFENPNSTPPSLIRMLSEITPQYARIFTNLCSLAVLLYPITENGLITVSPSQRIIIKNSYSYLKKLNINFSTLNELEMLGLIHFSTFGYILRFDNTKFPQIRIVYGTQVQTVNKYKNESFPVGEIFLTTAGESLFQFVEKTIIDEHFDCVIEYLKNNDVEFTEQP